jgi:hypothetical protein
MRKLVTGGVEKHSQRLGLVLTTLPIRFTSTHLCYNDPGLRVIALAFQKNFGKFTRLRTKTHYGMLCYSIFYRARLQIGNLIDPYYSVHFGQALLLKWSIL